MTTRTQLQKTTADGIISKLVRDIRERAGLGDVWSEIDVDLRMEIIAKWRGMILTELGDLGRQRGE